MTANQIAYQANQIAERNRYENIRHNIATEANEAIKALASKRTANANMVKAITGIGEHINNVASSVLDIFF